MNSFCIIFCFLNFLCKILFLFLKIFDSVEHMMLILFCLLDSDLNLSQWIVDRIVIWSIAASRGCSQLLQLSGALRNDRDLTRFKLWKLVREIALEFLLRATATDNRCYWPTVWALLEQLEGFFDLNTTVALLSWRQLLGATTRHATRVRIGLLIRLRRR